MRGRAFKKNSKVIIGKKLVSIRDMNESILTHINKVRLKQLANFSIKKNTLI